MNRDTHFSGFEFLVEKKPRNREKFSAAEGGQKIFLRAPPGRCRPPLVPPMISIFLNSIIFLTFSLTGTGIHVPFNEEAFDAILKKVDRPQETSRFVATL